MNCSQCHAKLDRDVLVCPACATRQEFDLRDADLPIIGGKKCLHCGGRLEGNLKTCPFCEARQNIDLRGLCFSDHGANESLPCPDCHTPLHVITIELVPAIVIERCPTCMGMFFNHGELEELIDQQTHDLPKVDKERMRSIAKHYGYNHEVTYLPCPMCRHLMSHRNFGGNSGVILDRCPAHGLWIQGGELRRLMEWWAFGGKRLRRETEAVGDARFDDLLLPPEGASTSRRSGLATDSPETENDPWTHDSLKGAVLDAVGSTLFGLLTLLSK